MENTIKNAVIKAALELYKVDIEDSLVLLQNTRKEFEGDFTVVVFPLLKISKKGPEDTANDLGNILQKEIDEVIGFNVIKGFLNLELNDTYWTSFLKRIFENSFLDLARKENGESIMVEYSQPNTNKPLHLGHLRNNILGFSLSNILDAYGYNVIKANIINDRGIHICKSMLAWQKWGKGETPESSNLKGDKLVGKYYVEFDKNYKKEIAELEARGISKEEASKKAPST